MTHRELGRVAAAAAACHDTMKLLRRLVTMLTASGAARAADPLPAGVHESQMAACGAAPQTFWFQQFGGGGDGQIVLANDGLDGQVPGEPTMCIDVGCGKDAKGYTCGTDKDWPDNQELQFWRNDSSIRWLVGGERCGASSKPMCLWHGGDVEHASMVPCPTDKLVTDPAGQWKWGAPTTNATAKPLVNTKSGLCYQLLPRGRPAPAPPPCA